MEGEMEEEMEGEMEQRWKRDGGTASDFSFNLISTLNLYKVVLRETKVSILSLRDKKVIKATTRSESETT